jgi:hypothetical protein
MKKILLLIFVVISSESAAVYPDKKVQLEVVDNSGESKHVVFDLPPQGELLNLDLKDRKRILDSILTRHGVYCPPKREKISANIWKCGNGNKVRTNDARLTLLLSTNLDK